MSDDTQNTLVMTLDTGPVTIRLRPDLAPGHVTRMKELVGEGFYDGVVFHRVIPGFMAQGGGSRRHRPRRIRQAQLEGGIFERTSRSRSLLNGADQ